MATGAAILSSALAAAHLRRATFGAAMDKLLAKLDFIVSPATAIPAYEVGAEIPDDVILDRRVHARSFTFPINLSQQPPVSTPCGLTVAGLPIGLQFVGARGAWTLRSYQRHVISNARAIKVVPRANVPCTFSCGARSGDFAIHHPRPRRFRRPPIMSVIGIARHSWS
jgi:Amidase